MAYWLMKSEPGSYSWADLVRDGKTEWDGIRKRPRLPQATGGDEASSTKARQQVGDGLRRTPPGARRGDGAWLRWRRKVRAEKAVSLRRSAAPRLAKREMIPNRGFGSPRAAEEWRCWDGG